MQITIVDGMRICTDFVYPPIPIRTMDWTAWIDGNEEDGIYGHGATESDAVADLLDTLDMRDELEAEDAS